MLSFWFLSTVHRSNLSALLYSLSIKHTAHNSIAYADVFHFSTSKQYHGVFLKIVAFAWDICCNFHTVCKANSGDLSDSRVWLLWSLGCNLRAHTSLER